MSNDTGTDSLPTVYHTSGCGASVGGKTYAPAADGGITVPHEVAKHLVQSFGFRYEKPEAAPKAKAK